MKPASEALAFRIWQYCQPIEWNASIVEIADALDANPSVVSKVLHVKGWLPRIRSERKFHVEQDARMGGDKRLKFDNASDGFSYRKLLGGLHLETEDDAA